MSTATRTQASALAAEPKPEAPLSSARVGGRGEDGGGEGGEGGGDGGGAGFSVVTVPTTAGAAVTSGTSVE
jgi:hypothetical protein